MRGGGMDWSEMALYARCAGARRDEPYLLPLMLIGSVCRVESTYDGVRVVRVCGVERSMGRVDPSDVVEIRK